MTSTTPPTSPAPTPRSRSSPRPAPPTTSPRVNLHEKNLAFNLGGHVNHSVFWQNLSPDGGDKPAGELGAAIDEFFGSFEASRSTSPPTRSASRAPAGRSSRGTRSARSSSSCSSTTSRATSPLGLVPVVVLDMWEHAFYLDYVNVKADYVKAWWNIVNWADAAARFDRARTQTAGLSSPSDRPARTPAGRRRPGTRRWSAGLSCVRASRLDQDADLLAACRREPSSPRRRPSPRLAADSQVSTFSHAIIVAATRYRTRPRSRRSSSAGQLVASVAAADAAVLDELEVDRGFDSACDHFPVTSLDSRAARQESSLLEQAARTAPPIATRRTIRTGRAARLPHTADASARRVKAHHGVRASPGVLSVRVLPAGELEHPADQADDPERDADVREPPADRQAGERDRGRRRRAPAATSSTGCTRPGRRRPARSHRRGRPRAGRRCAGTSSAK